MSIPQDLMVASFGDPNFPPPGGDRDDITPRLSDDNTSTTVINLSQKDKPQNGLLRLSNEILLCILELGHIDRQGIRSLALQTRRLFQLARPFFYMAEGCLTFQISCHYSDLDAIKRCFALGAAPVDMMCSIKVNQPFDYHHVFSMMGIAVQGLLDGSASAANCARTIRWLLDRDAPPDAEYGLVNSTSQQPLEAMKVVVQLLLNLLRRHNSADIETICNTISLLVDRNADLPVFPYYTLRNVPDFAQGAPITKWRPYGNADLGLLLDEYDIMPVGIALMLHLPPSLLETILKKYQRSGITIIEGLDPNLALPDPYKREDHESVAPGWFWPGEVDNGSHDIFLDRLVRSIHSHLFHPNGAWREAYSGEVADMLQEKVDILVKYNAIFECDRELLGSLVKAVRKVYEIGHNEGGWSMATNGYRCWQTLVAPLETIKTYAYRKALSDMNQQGLSRRLRFSVSMPAYWVTMGCVREHMRREVVEWDPEVEWERSVRFYEYHETLTDPTREEAIRSYDFSIAATCPRARSADHCCHCESC